MRLGEVLGKGVESSAVGKTVTIIIDIILERVAIDSEHV